MSVSCASEETLLEFIEGRLSPEAFEGVEQHLSQCETCRELVAVATPATSPEPAGGDEALASGGQPKVGRYEILSPIGAGGMGVVYAAHDPQLDRRVALKMLRPSGLPGVSPQQLRDRILREGRAMALLSHPNVLAVHDVGEFQDQVFVAMELVEGGSVTSWLRGRSRSWKEVLDVFLAAGRGLSAAHAKGLVHRDFKPDNILFGSDGRVRVTDFGVAQLTAFPGSEPLTAGTPEAGSPTVSLCSSALVGSPAYMAPEQMRGEQADVRADLFSFCVSLYEALYGERPFAGETVADLQRAVSESEVRPPPGGSRVPAWIRRALLRGLRAEPGERPQRMEALLASLSRPRHRWPPLAVGPTLALLAGIVVVVLAGALFLGSRKLLRAVPAQETSVTKAPPELVKQVATRLAVLPFESFGQAQENDFSEKVVTELTKELTQFAQTRRLFSVVSPTEMRNENAANLVLKGSVIQDGDRLIIAANLADAQKQSVLNATDVEGSTDQLPSLHRSLTKKVTEMLRVHLAEAPGARDLYLRGRGYLERYDRMENLNNAIAAFDKALSQDPPEDLFGAHVLAHAGRAEAYLRKYRLAKDEASLDRARESVMAAMKLNDQLAPVNFAMGLYRVATGDREGAVESFQRSLAIEEGPDATRELANSYDALNRLDLAEAMYRRAIQLRKGYRLGYKDLGVFYQKHGRLEEALPFFKLVAQLAPDDHTSYTNLGAMYLKLQMYSQAVAVYQKAIEIDPSPRAYHGLGTAFYLGHHYREAIDLYKKAVELYPTEGAYWGALGDAYRLVPGMVDYAVDAYEQAVLLKERELQIRPGDARLRADIASWLTLTNRRKALNEIQQALRLSPRNARVQATAASVYEQIGKRDQAIAAVEEAVKLGFAVAELQNWPPLEKLLLDPRYKRILATSIEGGTDATLGSVSAIATKGLAEDQSAVAPDAGTQQRASKNRRAPAVQERLGRRDIELE